MRLAILTTATLHHVYFVQQIAGRFPIARVYCETGSVRPSFDTFHPFEAARDQYEHQVWFKGACPHLADFAATETVASLNDPTSVASLAKLAPDAVLVFGTGRLAPPVIGIQPRFVLNLHGGDPEEYRGLDTHLWAIYHRDFHGLVTTLHLVTPVLDDGDIVSQAGVRLHRNMQLHQLRRANTEACVQLSVAALASIKAQGSVPMRAQRRHGRYYSFMPAALKGQCQRRFVAYTSRLSDTDE
jgi:methionyl-tRNA formyltransferase